MPKAAAPETTFPDPFFRSFYPQQRRVEAAPSLRDSYSQDAEMWGECVSPRQPLPAAAPMMPASDSTAPVNSFDLPTDAFDLVSPGGDVVQRSGLQKTDRADDAEQRWQVAASSYDRGVASSQRQREQPLRSNSPETIAIIEATTVRGLHSHHITITHHTTITITHHTTITITAPHSFNCTHVLTCRNQRLRAASSSTRASTMLDIRSVSSQPPVQVEARALRATSSSDIFQDSRSFATAPISPRDAMGLQHQQQQQQPLASPRDASRPVKPLPPPPVLTPRSQLVGAADEVATLGIDLK
jgi:hypothetical protein